MPHDSKALLRSKLLVGFVDWKRLSEFMGQQQGCHTCDLDKISTIWVMTILKDMLRLGDSY